MTATRMRHRRKRKDRGHGRQFFPPGSPYQGITKPVTGIARSCRRLRKTLPTRRRRTVVRSLHELPLARHRRRQQPRRAHHSASTTSPRIGHRSRSPATGTSSTRLPLRRHARPERHAPARPSSRPQARRHTDRADLLRPMRTRLDKRMKGLPQITWHDIHVRSLQDLAARPETRPELQ
jgi:hypothetical protein